MADPSDKYKDLDFLISRIGMPAVMCGLLIWFMSAEFSVFRKDVAWKLERCIRNERAIMQKLGIPVILDSDNPEKK